jgi:hypothetical protein
MVDLTLELKTFALTWNLWVMPFDSRVTANTIENWTTHENLMCCTTSNKRQGPAKVRAVCVNIAFSTLFTVRVILNYCRGFRGL